MIAAERPLTHGNTHGQTTSTDGAARLVTSQRRDETAFSPGPAPRTASLTAGQSSARTSTLANSRKLLQFYSGVPASHPASSAACPEMLAGVPGCNRLQAQDHELNLIWMLQGMPWLGDPVTNGGGFSD